jgi:hypothetical protein
MNAADVAIPSHGFSSALAEKHENGRRHRGLSPQIGRQIVGEIDPAFTEQVDAGAAG